MPGTDDPYRFFFTSSVAHQRDNFCLTGWMYDVGWLSLKIASPVSSCAHIHHTLLCSQPHVSQPQAIGDNENRAERLRHCNDRLGWRPVDGCDNRIDYS